MKKICLSLLFAITIQSYGQLNLNDSLILFFNFNNNINNQAQNKYHGQFTNGSSANYVVDANSRLDSAYMLTQDQEDILINDSIAFDDEFTVSVDFYSSGDNGHLFGYFFRTGDYPNDHLYLGLGGHSNIAPACTLWVDTTYDYGDHHWWSDTVSFKQWNNLIYEFRSDSITIFKNGIKGSSFLRTTSFNNKKFGLGHIGKWNTYPDNMHIDNLVIYGRKLNATEINYYGDVNRSMSLVSISEHPTSTNQIQLYPNPTSDYVTIKGEKVIAATAFSINGQAVPVNYSNNKIDLFNLNKGLYYIAIQTAKGTFVKKVIKH